MEAGTQLQPAPRGAAMYHVGRFVEAGGLELYRWRDAAAAELVAELQLKGKRRELFQSLFFVAFQERGACVQVQQAARALFVSRRSLCRWLPGAELPGPRRVLAWGQIIRAAYMIRAGAGVNALSLTVAGDAFALTQLVRYYGATSWAAWRAEGCDLAALCRALLATWRLGGES